MASTHDSPARPSSPVEAHRGDEFPYIVIVLDQVV